MIGIDILILGYISDCTKEGGGAAGRLDEGVATVASDGGPGRETDEDI